MADPARIRIRCLKIARTLHSAGGLDHLEMLRAARVLKRSQTDLKRIVWERGHTEGWSHTTAQALATLDTVELDLRHVLLDYAGLRPAELYDHLTHAVSRSIQTLDMLQGNPVATARAVTAE